MSRLLFVLPLFAGCLLPGAMPLEKDWSGSMEVAVLDDVRIFTIEITEVVWLPNCADEPDAEDGCMTTLAEGSFDLYRGTASYGGDATLEGEILINHCVGTDCTIDGVEVDKGFLSLSSTWSDGQSIVLQGSATGDDPSKASGDAWYYYTGGAMTGTFELAGTAD